MSILLGMIVQILLIILTNHKNLHFFLVLLPKKWCNTNVMAEFLKAAFLVNYIEFRPITQLTLYL